MLSTRTLRRSGASVGHCRQQLICRARSSRQFSMHTSNTFTPRQTRPSPSTKQCLAYQKRSLSLFGWGGSSKPVPDSGSTPSASDVQIGHSTAGLDNVRTIKATHATSDVPDPTQAHLHAPNQIEPQFIEDIQEKLTLPHGAAGERIAEIVEGDIDLSGASERAGYLKEVCGLDFGWGPSTMMENLLEWLHVTGGLSWTTSIVVLAAILRLAMIKPIIDSQKQGNKMREMQPYIAPLRAKYQQLMASGDRANAMAVGQEMKEINKSAGISYTRAFVPMLIQFPFSFGAFRVLRNAGQLPVPAFVTEDWLWTTDLSFSDPYFITPAISAGAIALSFRLQQKGATPNAMLGPQMLKVIGTVLPAASFVFMAFQPGSVQLYFMTTGIMAYGTTWLLRQQFFRDMVGLGQLPGSTPPSPTTTPGTPQTSQSQSYQNKSLPSNIQLLNPVKATIESVEPESKPTPNRSVIDRGVDNVKGQWKNLKESVTTSGVGKKMAEKEKDQRKASAARYEALRQQQLERERQARNQEVRGRRP